MKKTKTKIIFLIILLNYIFPLFQGRNITKIIEKKNNKKRKGDEMDIKLLLLILILGVFFFGLFFGLISKVIEDYCKKKKAKELLEHAYEKQYLTNPDVLNKIRNEYGLEHIFEFMFNRIFLTYIYNKEEKKDKYGGNCSICLDAFKNEEKIIVTSCYHTFHYKCMYGYLDDIKVEIIKKKEVPGIQNYFRCPNCNEFLFITRLDAKHQKRLDYKNRKISMLEEKKVNNNIMMLSDGDSYYENENDNECEEEEVEEGENNENENNVNIDNNNMNEINNINVGNINNGFIRNLSKEEAKEYENLGFRVENRGKLLSINQIILNRKRSTNIQVKKLNHKNSTINKVNFNDNDIQSSERKQIYRNNIIHLRSSSMNVIENESKQNKINDGNQQNILTPVSDKSEQIKTKNYVSSKE